MAMQINELDDQQRRHLHRSGAPQREGSDNQTDHLEPRARGAGACLLTANSGKPIKKLDTATSPQPKNNILQMAKAKRNNIPRSPVPAKPDIKQLFTSSKEYLDKTMGLIWLLYETGESRSNMAIS
uniref:Uncharacterized protein n=1 Tax=Romanomermis culicivorax TaxID=13658 RepID=A0A915I8V0_ROMCU